MEHIGKALNRGLLRVISDGLVSIADHNWKNARAAQKLRDAAASILDADAELERANANGRDAA